MSVTTIHAISTHTRAQAIEDGDLVDVSTMAKEAGITFPVAVTRAVWDGIITPDPRSVKAMGQSVNGRLWDTLWMLHYAIKRLSDSTDTVLYRCYFILKAKQRRLLTLKAVCSPGDSMEPVITVMLPQEH